MDEANTRCSLARLVHEDFRDFIADECPRCQGSGNTCLADVITDILADAPPQRIAHTLDS